MRLARGRGNQKKQIIIILAKCPNTVWVLHREKVVLGVALSCYVVLGSRVVLCCVYLKSIGNPGFGGGLGWFVEAVCSDS